MAPDSRLEIRVSRVHYPVTVLGPGRRLGIWLQGCSIGCPGCVSLDTWDPDAGTKVTVADLVLRCTEIVDGPITGVTISGGEPFDQPTALAALVDALRQAATRSETLDVLCYSGRTESWLRRRAPEVLSRMDAVIAGPYRRDRGQAGALAGSANQRLLLLSPIGHERFRSVETGGRPRMQVAIEDGQVWMIGIPRPGDMERIEADLASRGVELSGVSWR